MKKTMFRGITMLLVVVMLMSVSMFPAFAADYETNPSYGQNPYKDVKESDWFYNDVMYCYEHNIMLGVGDGKFAPENYTTRAEMAQAMYRLLKGSETSWVEPFTDVNPSDWFAVAVNWCYANSIVYGTSETTYSPNKNVTREQAVAILFRSAKSVNANTSGGYYGNFADASMVSDYAIEAWGWSVNNRIIMGERIGYYDYLQPNRNITRAELATILARFVRWLENGQVPEPAPDPVPDPVPNPDRVLVRISLRFTDDAKLVYKVGEEVDTTGVTVTAHYSDRTTEVVTDYKAYLDTSTVGSADVKITYKGCENSYAVTVVSDDPNSVVDIYLEVSEGAKLTYEVGETIDFTGVTVYAVYADGHKEVVTDYTYSCDTSMVGRTPVYIYYGAFTDWYDISVVVPNSERLDTIEARDAGNAHAQEIGFLNCDTSLEPTEDCTCEETTEYYPHNEVMENGGQEYLNQLAEKAADEFKAYLQQRAEENEDIPDDAWMRVTLNVYVSWCDYTQGYKIQVLYR